MCHLAIYRILDFECEGQRPVHEPLLHGNEKYYAIINTTTIAMSGDGPTFTKMNTPTKGEISCRKISFALN